WNLVRERAGAYLPRTLPETSLPVVVTSPAGSSPLVESPPRLIGPFRVPDDRAAYEPSADVCELARAELLWGVVPPRPRLVFARPRLKPLRTPWVCVRPALACVRPGALAEFPRSPLSPPAIPRLCLPSPISPRTRAGSKPAGRSPVAALDTWLPGPVVAVDALPGEVVW